MSLFPARGECSELSFTTLKNSCSRTAHCFLWLFFTTVEWTVDTVETHDKAVHVMCASSGCVFASVDYRLAPENRFPAGIEDAYTGLQWIYDNAEKIGVDREKIAVCGDSSGGNFAAVVCQMARDRGGVPSAIRF